MIHPVTDSLEDRNPVSIGFLSAATAGLAASVSTLDVPAQTAESETAMAPIVLSTPIGSPISLALHSSQASAVPQSRAEPSPSIAALDEDHAQPVADPPHHPVSVDDPFASTIITLSAVSSPGRSLLGVSQQPTFSGLVPNPSSATAPRNTVPASRGATDDGVRPMTLAPSAAAIDQDASSSSHALQSGTTAAGDMIALDNPSGGGGDPGPGPKAIMSVTSGGGAVSDGNGGYVGVIGGMVMMSVRPGGSETIQSADWEIDGAIKQQNYTLEKGETIPLPDPFEGPGPGPGTTMAHFTFYWDATTGDHTIDATVNYVGGRTGAVDPITVNVTKPIVSSLNGVSSFKADYKPLHFGVDLGRMGLYSSTTLNPNLFAADGIKFSATITTPPKPEMNTYYFGIIQKILPNYKIIAYNPITEESKTYSALTTDYVVDDNPINHDLFTAYQTPVGEAEPAGTTVTIPHPLEYAADDPRVVTDVLHGDGSEPHYFKIKAYLVSYLAFKPKSGIWVALSSFDWSRVGEATYKGAGDYKLPQNWNVNITDTATSGTYNGTNFEEFVSWDDYASKYQVSF